MPFSDVLDRQALNTFVYKIAVNICYRATSQLEKTLMYRRTLSHSMETCFWLKKQTCSFVILIASLSIEYTTNKRICNSLILNNVQTKQFACLNFLRVKAIKHKTTKHKAHTFVTLSIVFNSKYKTGKCFHCVVTAKRFFKSPIQSCLSL